MNGFIIPEELVDRIEKGDSFSYPEIRSYLPPHQGETQRRVAVVEWADKLEKALGAAGKPCTVVAVQGSHRVAILTDSEASEHNADRFKAYLRRAGKRHGHMIDVDVSNLGEQERRSHERSLTIQAAKMAAIASVRRVVPVVAHERSTPAIKIESTRGARPC